jgi:hypothetical protein
MIFVKKNLPAKNGQSLGERRRPFGKKYLFGGSV